MSIFQFLRIFWARRLIVLVTMIASFLGAYVVTLLVQPRYEATSRVLLNILRPDPITGDVIGRAAGTYFEAQVELVKDYSVTGAVVDALGFLSDPGQIAAYQRRPSSDTRDFRRWLAQDVSDATKVNVNGTVLDITYRAPSPAAARIGAEVLRNAYLEASLANRRSEASKNASFYTTQAENARKLAENAELAKAAYEKQSGIIMDRGQSDMESERLAALASQAAAGTVATAAPTTSTSAMELAQLDARIEDLSTKIGPNHPAMQELKSRRASIAKLAEQDRIAQQAASRGVTGREALNEALAEQKTRVIAQRDKVERLRQLQGEVELRRDQYRSAAAKAGQFTLESSAVDNGLSPLGVVVTPKDPVFPNKKLMVGGAVALGAALGLAISLLLELLNRRVRGIEDLQLSREIPCLCVIEEPGLAVVVSLCADSYLGVDLPLGWQREQVRPKEEALVPIEAPPSAVLRPVEQAPISPMLTTLSQPLSAAAEAIRALRTHVLAQHIHAGRRGLVICGPSLSVGCTYVATNLAVALAQVGLKTLLVDGDLRAPAVQTIIPPRAATAGLTGCLGHTDSRIGDFINSDLLPNSAFFAGEASVNAQELLAREWFADVMHQCLRDYDITIVDSPPANTSADVRRISNVLGYSLVVARRNKSLVSDVRVLVEQLIDDHATVIGTVMNAD